MGKKQRLVFHRQCVYRKGDLAHVISEAKRLYEACCEMRDHKHSGWSLEVWSRASGGRLPAVIVEREMQKKRNDIQTTAQILLAEGVRRVGQSELDEAIKIFSQAHEMCRKSGMKRLGTPILPWMATAIRLQRQISTDLVAVANCSQRHRTARQALAVARSFGPTCPTRCTKPD